MTATGVMGECERRLTRHYFELRRLYGELYNGDMRAFDYFCTMLRRTYGERSEELRRTDRERPLPETCTRCPPLRSPFWLS